MDNPKGDLEQFYYSRGNSPIYTSCREGGEHHNPIWKVELLLEDGQVFEIVHQGKIVDAQKILAKNALEYIKQKEEVLITDMMTRHFPLTSNIRVNVAQPTTILIDLLTVPKAFSLASYIDDESKVCVIGYVVKGSIADMQKFIPNMEKRIVESKKSGAIIIAMTIDIAINLSSVDERIIIISANRSITAIQELSIKDRKTITFKNLEECLRFLQ